jgi:hypothetical protein
MSMQEFMQPGQMMSQQLQGIVQQAAQTAMDKRTMLAYRQEQRAAMQQDMENNFNVAKTLYSTNKELSLEFFNKGLKHMGREVTMENFDPAFKLFDDAAQLRAKGDTPGMMALLGASKELLVNVHDRARAVKMMQEGADAQAKEQAGIIQELEGKPAGVDRAEKILSIAEAMRKPEYSPEQKVMMAPGVREQLVHLVGSDSEEDLNRAVEESQAIVNGYQSKRKLYERMIRNEPKSFDQYAQQSGAALGNPKIMAEARIAELLQKPTRTGQEDAELSAKIDVYGADSLRALHNERSAANVKAQTLAKLEDTGNRLAAIGGNLELYDDASISSSQIDGAAKGLPDGPMTDQQAKDAALIHGTRAAKREAFEGQNKQKVGELLQASQMADAQALELTRRAVSAFPAQREKIDDQIKEFKAMSKANGAMARLLGDENPYAIAQREANLKFLPELEQEDERKAIDAIKAKRDEDVETVQAEKARLARREAILRTQLPKAERDEKNEENMRMAIQGVAEARNQGRDLTPAIRDASKYFNVSAAELSKKVNEFYGSGIFDAQTDYASRMVNWAKTHGGQAPSHMEALGIKRDVAKKWNVDMKDLGNLEKDPNQPSVSIKMIDPTAERAMVDARSRITQIKQVRDLYKSKYVGVLDDFFAKWASPVGALSKEENQFRAQTKKLVAELKRFYIGAAQTKPELAGLVPVLPDTFNSENEFNAALDAAENFAKIYLGEASAVADEMGQKHPSPNPAMTPAQRDAFEQLKKARPEASESAIREFILKSVK